MNDKACSECCSTQALNQKPSKAEELNLNCLIWQTVSCSGVSCKLRVKTSKTNTLKTWKIDELEGIRGQHSLLGLVRFKCQREPKTVYQ